MNKILFYSLILASCGKASDVYVNQDSHVQVNECTDNSMHASIRYKYTYTTDTCSTDCHSAQSKQDYCAVLKDDAINNNCAKDERKKALEEEKCER